MVEQFLTHLWTGVPLVIGTILTVWSVLTILAGVAVGIARPDESLLSYIGLACLVILAIIWLLFAAGWLISQPATVGC